MPVLLLSAIAYLIYSSSQNLINKISFAPKDIDFKKQIFTLSIINPTDTSVKIEKINGFIYAGKNSIGTYSINQPFNIAAKNKTDIAVKINLDPILVLNNLSSVLMAGKTPQINITGNIKTAVGSFNFENTLVDPINLNSVNAKN